MADQRNVSSRPARCHTPDRLPECVSSRVYRNVISFRIHTVSADSCFTVTNSAVRRVDGVSVCMRKDDETRYDGIGR